MKAAIFKGVGQPLAIEERPQPVPGPHQVLIKVGRVGICGTDLHMTSGHGQQYPLESIPGHEYAGEVVALGPEVTRLKVGDRIAPMPMVGCGKCGACLTGEYRWCEKQTMAGLGGAFCQYALAGEHESAILGPDASDVDGALIEPLAVGLHGVRMAEMPLGSRVLVLGAGAIGLAAAYWAKKLGAGKVVVTAHSDRRGAIAKAMGAHAFVAQKGLTDEEAGKAFNAALGGEPDIIIEAVGLGGVIAKAINWVKMRGTIVSLGFFGEPDTIIPAICMWKQVRLQFSMVYDLTDFQYVADTLATDRTPRAMITDTVALEKLAPKFENMRASSSTDCKVMIDPWG
jgi:2-desacetyl-2-hydroxyethyl bacteriochlorophyllide A dehydrogenase